SARGEAMAAKTRESGGDPDEPEKRTRSENVQKIFTVPGELRLRCGSADNRHGLQGNPDAVIRKNDGLRPGLERGEQENRCQDSLPEDEACARMLLVEKNCRSRGDANEDCDLRRPCQ